MPSEQAIIPISRIERVILLIRGEKVILDASLARLYGVSTKVLNQAVRRNLERFPEDFMFRLAPDEVDRLRPHAGAAGLRSQFVTSNKRGGRRYPPYVFTELGVAMLSSVLRSPKAVQVNIEIMRAFVHLRQLLSSNTGLARKLRALERKYDAQFKIVFDAIRQLMIPPKRKRHRIGFEAGHTD